MDESIANAGAGRFPNIAKGFSPIRIGFVRLVDAAPVLAASAFGFFAKRGLKVELARLVGWATVREKLVFGEIDLAQALCPMPYAATLGIGSVPSPCVAGLVLNRGGNAIVLSANLWKRGVHDAKSLRQDISNSRHFRKYILATVHECSSHAYLLGQWLRSAGMDPERDVQLVALPPAQMCRNLAVGTIDGFCAGEPWPSMAIADETGWSPATSADVSPGHPEKVLMARQAFDRDRAEEHLEVIAALLEACRFCSDPANRSDLARLLADRRCVGCDSALLERCLSPEFNYGMDKGYSKAGFNRFYGDDVNRPGTEAASWVVRLMKDFYPEIGAASYQELDRRVFRPDLYDRAVKLAHLAEV